MGSSVFILILAFLWSSSLFSAAKSGAKPDSDKPLSISRKSCTEAKLKEKYVGSVSDGDEDIYCFDYSSYTNYNATVRVTVSSNTSTDEFPLLVVSRQQRGVLSWSVPLITEENYVYQTVSRNLCPSFFFNRAKSVHPLSNEFFIDISTSSTSNVSYVLETDLVEDFEIGVNQNVKATVTPSQPEYFLFKFPPGIDTVIVKAESDSSICAILSIQGTKCPVFDLARNVEFTGMFQTMTKKAGITLERRNFVNNQTFVVLVVKPDDAECKVGRRSINPSFPPESKKMQEKRIFV